MLIQNVSNSAQSVRLTGEGAPIVVAKPSDVAVAPSPVPTPDQLKSAVANLNQAMRQSNQSLEFSVDSATNKPIVKMVDTVTGELIRQYPTEETLAISRSIDQFIQRQGLLLNREA